MLIASKNLCALRLASLVAAMSTFLFRGRGTLPAKKIMLNFWVGIRPLMALVSSFFSAEYFVIMEPEISQMNTTEPTSVSMWKTLLFDGRGSGSTRDFAGGECGIAGCEVADAV